MMNDELKIVSLILSIGSVVSPVLFGFILWKMSQVFVSKTEFNEYKSGNTRELEKIEESLGDIARSTQELLQRTAGQRRQ